MNGIYTRVVKERITLDHFVTKNNYIPEVIKIDVEEVEMKVLLGAKEVLPRYHPQIILSVHPKRLKSLGHSVDELSELFSNLGYRIYTVDGVKIDKRLEFEEYLLN